MEYLGTRDPPIKYMSFHAYLKKLQGGGDRLVNRNTKDFSTLRTLASKKMASFCVICCNVEQNTRT